MFVLPQRADEERVWRIFEVFAKEVGREINTGNLHFYFTKTEQAVCPFKHQPLFASIYRKFSIHGASHLGRHIFVSKLVNAGVNICIVQKLANHKNISTTQHYFNANEQMLANAVENVKI